MLNAVKQFFRPEFLNRIDAQLVFHSLTAEQLDQVFDIMLGDLRSRLDERGITLDLDRGARSLLLDEAAAQNQGARPLRRLIEAKIEDPLSDLILSGVPQGATINGELKNGELSFKVRASRRRRAKKPVVEVEAEVVEE